MAATTSNYAYMLGECEGVLAIVAERMQVRSDGTAKIVLPAYAASRVRELVARAEVDGAALREAQACRSDHTQPVDGATPAVELAPSKFDRSMSELDGGW